ncbi:MAG: NUDIX domain-containing protein [Streptosporangiaceae bacterium]
MSGAGEDFQGTQDQLAALLSAALQAAQNPSDHELTYQRASWLVDILTAGATAAARLRATAVRGIRDTERLSIAALGRKLGVSKARAADILRATDTRQPEPPPAAAAVVTSRLGVLLGRRNDGSQPWTFIAGQVRPGESPADTAVRACKEQAGLDIVPIRELGRQADWAAGITMVYLAARPAADDLRIDTEKQAELAEVAWVSLPDAEARLPGILDSVHAYLSRALRIRELPTRPPSAQP